MRDPVICKIDVTWGDCDPAGIVFYPSYFRWFDAGSQKLMTASGNDHRDIVARFGIVGAPLVSAQCNFRRPVSYGDRLLHHVRVLQWRVRSFVLAHTILRDEDIVAEGTETRVLMAQDGDGACRAIPIPEPFRETLGSSGGD